MAKEAIEVEVEGTGIRVSNPSKVWFPETGITKLDVVSHFLRCGDALMTHVRDRPTTLHRFPDGVGGELEFWQKRLNGKHPDWISTATVHFPSGRQADMLVCESIASVIWAVNLGCLELHPWPVRSSDTDHPDTLRVDLDPTPEFNFEHVKEVAPVVESVLAEHGLVGWPKTSGKRGLHIYCRIEPLWDFTEVRRAALALGREVERRIPELATTAWWKEERSGVFVDYNQNARDRTIASAYSIRPSPHAPVSTPVTFAELPTIDPSSFTVSSFADRLDAVGDAHAGMESAIGILDSLLDLAQADEDGGLSDAPWPPHFPKQPNEPVRAQPSKRRTPDSG